MPPDRKAGFLVHDRVAYCHEKGTRDEAHDFESDEMSRLYLEDLPYVSGRERKRKEKKNPPKTSQRPRLLHGPVAPSPYQGSLAPVLKLPKIAIK